MTFFYIQKGVFGLDASGSQQEPGSGTSKKLSDSMKITATKYKQMLAEQQSGRRSSASGHNAKGKPEVKVEDLLMEEYEPYREFFRKGYAGFSMNTSHLFFWNGTSVWNYDIGSKFAAGSMEKLALKVSKLDPLSKIKRVRTGSTEDQVVIVLKQSRQDMCSIVWDVHNNTEIECFDHGLDSGVFWGSKGDSYVITNDKIYVSEMGLCLK